MGENNTNLRELPDEIGSPMSILTDSEITHAMSLGYFFRDDGDGGFVRQASYELRVSETASLLMSKSKLDFDVGNKIAWLEKVEGKIYISIGPLQSVKLFSHEDLVFPDNVVGRVSARGQLFEGGLVVESTYIDPGFSGSIHLSAFNMTSKTIKIPVGAKLARLEFFKLNKAVKNPHGGRNSIKHPELKAVDIKPKEVTDYDKNENSEILERISSVNTNELYDERHIATAAIIKSSQVELKKIEVTSVVNRLLIYGIIFVIVYMNADLFETFIPNDYIEKYREIIKSPLTFITTITLPFLALSIRSDFRKNIGVLAKHIRGI